MSAPVIRRARHGDLDAVAALERAAMAGPWSRRALRDAIDAARGDDGDGRFWVVTAGEPARPVAYAYARLVADEAELLRLAVASEHRRRGLGASLLERVLARLAEDGAAACHLEVEAGNEAAIALYRRLGFAASGRRPRYYPESGEDALVMRLELA